MDIKRLLYFLAFFGSVFLLWDAWKKEHPEAPPAVQVAAQQQANSEIPSRPQQPVQQSVATTAAQSVPESTPATPAKAPEVAFITISTDIFKATIDPIGASLVQVSLLTHKANNETNDPLVLLNNTTKDFFAAQTGLTGEHNLNHLSEFSLISHTGAKNTIQTLTFEAKNDQGIRLIKMYTFTPGSYLISVSQTVKNLSGQPVSIDGYYQLVRRELTSDEMKEKGIEDRTHFGPAFYTSAEKFTKLSFKDILKNSQRAQPEEITPVNVSEGWIAMTQQFFVSAWIPDASNKATFDIYARSLGKERYSTGLIIPFGEIKPGQQATEKLSLYVGPQAQDKLEAVAPGFDLVVDYGWFTIIASPLFWALSFIHGFVQNWGVAIIILTLIIKLIFFPLTAASQKSMARMKEVSPKIKQLQELYKDDRERLNKEMMALYQTEKINPLGGCLPIIIQIPVFIALYWVLLSSVEIRHAPFALWITDLSARDPYFILPLLLGVSSFLQTRMNPPPPDPIQAKVVTFLPIIFTAMFMFFPAGLVLYWLVSNLVSIGQQWYINRRVRKKN